MSDKLTAKLSSCKNALWLLQVKQDNQVLQALPTQTSIESQLDLVEGVCEQAGQYLAQSQWSQAIHMIEALLQNNQCFALTEFPQKHRQMLVIKAEAELGLGEYRRAYETASKAFKLDKSPPGLVVLVKAALACSIPDDEMVGFFSVKNETRLGRSTYQCFHMIAERRGAQLAFDCLMEAFPQPINPHLEPDVLILKMAIACNDPEMDHAAKLDYVRNVVASVSLAQFDPSCQQTVFDLFSRQIQSCIQVRATNAKTVETLAILAFLVFTEHFRAGSMALQCSGWRLGRRLSAGMPLRKPDWTRSLLSVSWKWVSWKRPKRPS